MAKNSGVVVHPSSDLTALVSFDVGMDEVFWRSEMLGVLKTRHVPNRLNSVRELLEDQLAMAEAAGFSGIRLALEPSGAYHESILRIAKQLGIKKEWVNPEVLKKLRFVESGDDGKTDIKDPRVVELAAFLGKTLIQRDLPHPYNLLREWNKVYERAELGMIHAKCLVNPLIKQLLPDFDFGKDFLYGPSTRALVDRFGANPFKITKRGIKAFNRRMKQAVPRIRSKSIDRLYTQAKASVDSGLDEGFAEVLEHQIRLAFEDLEIEERRREEAGEKLVHLYHLARIEDPNLPEPTDGVLTPLRGARIIAETGPLSDFRSIQQLYRFVGINLIERSSGTYRGRTRTAKKGRKLGNKILNQAAFALSRKGRLFADYYHSKKSTMEGAKAMTATARKYLKMFFGWYKSGAAFDHDRVFLCAGERAKAA